MGKRRKRSRQSSAALLRNGLKAFQDGDYGQAIETWERVGGQTPDMYPVSASAEAYFRRGLDNLYGDSPDPAAGLRDLERATELKPDDACYVYHLGLATHRQGDVERAVQAYRDVREGEGEFAQRAAYPLALALLQLDEDPTTDPVWGALSPEEQVMLTEAGAFRRRPYTLSPEAPPLWHGMAALDEGEYEVARSFLETGLEKASNLVERQMARYYLGVLAAQEEDWDEARRHWNSARSAGFDIPRLTDNLGETYHRLAEEWLVEGEVEDALLAAKEAARHKEEEKPSFAQLLSQIHQQLAYQAVSAGKWSVALEHWQKAEEAEGGSFRLAYNMALAYERDERFLDAAERWREVLRRRPRKDDHPDAIDDEQVAQLWSRAARAYNKAGEFDEAVHVYRQAVKWNPDHVETRLRLAETLLVNGQIQAAENELERILERDPEYVPALLQRGEVALASGSWWRWESPVVYWERVLEIEPDNPLALQLLADFYVDQAEYSAYWDDPSRAIELYEKALEYKPKDGAILAALGGCYLDIGEEEKAQSYIEQALEEARDNLDAYAQILRFLIDIDEIEWAIEVMEQAESAISRIPPHFYIVHGLYAVTQEIDQGCRWLERAVEVAPSDMPILLMIGDMAFAVRAWEIAREYLERAVEAGQEPGRSYFLLGLAAAQQGDEKGARRYWHQAEWLARREQDEELWESIEYARFVLGGGYGPGDLFEGLPPFPDFLDDEEDDFEF